ncbi:hypothetical protein MMC07_005997 [Pseudocyphellaria aurata]|nr:hypothetical protein [Pseudocyphellaria aurata]
MLVLTLLSVIILAVGALSAPRDPPASTTIDHRDAISNFKTAYLALNKWPSLIDSPDPFEDTEDVPFAAEKSPVPEVSVIAKVIQVERNLSLFYTGSAFSALQTYRKSFEPPLKSCFECTPREYWRESKWDDIELFLHRWSAAFALASSGIVYVLIPPEGPMVDSHWELDEWPILNGNNPNVDEVIAINSDDFSNTTVIYKKH